jgi:hypothetical protein
VRAPRQYIRLRKEFEMKKIVLILIVLLLATSAFAGGGKSCDRNAAAKNVKLTGVIECAGDDCAKAQLVVDDQKYTICDKSEVELTSLNGARVTVSGKLVNCGEGDQQELVIQSAAKI